MASSNPSGSLSNLARDEQNPFLSPKDDLLSSPVSSQDTPVVSSLGTKSRPEHLREGSLPVLNSDPTCTPPVTPGRQRTLILCFDGTRDQYDDDNSNIVKIFSMLKKDETDLQMCYYQPGIGTYSERHFLLKLNNLLASVWDSAVAWSIDAHVQGGYEFLMQNYKAGDRVCLFGFSRGAYTARALAGMLHKVGLLPAYNKQQVHFAWKMYKDTSDDGWKLSRQFKKSFCLDVNVDFVGVFDTVASVGVIGKKLPFAASNFSIRAFRHAMALDERRARFKVAHWTKSGYESVDSNDDESVLSSLPVWMQKAKRVKKVHGNVWREVEDVETDVKEVWFAGCHCDVGGGSVTNDTPNCLANIPLRWMIRETFRCHTGILWNINALKEVGLDHTMLYPNVVVPKFGVGGTTSAEQEADTVEKSDEEHHDALSPIFDQLILKPFWWFLELLPVMGRRQYPAPIDVNRWFTYTFINLGKGRLFPRTEDGMTYIHRSVKTRTDHDNEYQWKAIGDAKPAWVD